MRQRFPSWLAIGLVLAVAALMPRHRALCDGFLPPNNMRIPVGDAKALGLNEDQFNAVLDRVEQVYAPIVSAKGGHLVVERLWDDPTVNAVATQDGNDWTIHMYGGLARHQGVNEDGFTLVACHELGHHLGGHPKISGTWATNEGGADYFGTLKCLRRVLSADAPSVVDPVARKKCAAQFKQDGDRNACERGAMAGVALASLLNELGGGPNPPSLGSPDRTVVRRTNDDHPRAQCRLDTYFQGSLCTKPVSEDLDNSDPRPGACDAADGFTVGVRPLCWYRPPATPPSIARLPRTSLPDVGLVADRLEAMRGDLLGRGL